MLSQSLKNGFWKRYCGIWFLFDSCITLQSRSVASVLNEKWSRGPSARPIRELKAIDLYCWKSSRCRVLRLQQHFILRFDEAVCVFRKTFIGNSLLKRLIQHCLSSSWGLSLGRCRSFQNFLSTNAPTVVLFPGTFSCSTHVSVPKTCIKSFWHWKILILSYSKLRV